jgi:hypothetical protein
LLLQHKIKAPTWLLCPILKAMAQSQGSNFRHQPKRNSNQDSNVKINVPPFKALAQTKSPEDCVFCCFTPPTPPPPVVKCRDHAGISRQLTSRPIFPTIRLSRLKQWHF